MYGLITRCKTLNGEEFGKAIAVVGDVNHDGLNDWIIEHYRCDTVVRYSSSARYPEEVLLYKGVRGGLPDAGSVERIGPSELGSMTRFLAAGDWDGDGNVDIATSIQILGDTSFDNVNADYDLFYLVIFWGNHTGEFSVGDTTRLSSGAYSWGSLIPGPASDIDGDGVDDLMVGSYGNVVNYGSRIYLPHFYIFRGHRKQRWGRGGISITGDVRWWNRPGLTNLASLDQDGDGVKDIVMYAQGGGSTGYVSVLYGRAGELPDTNDVESIDLKVPNGHYALLSDVTGDRVPELLVNTGVAEHENRVKVYLGLRGQRLKAMFGSGNDRPDSIVGQWWGRPWSEIWMPHRVQSNWGEADYYLADLGDGNLDGVGDLWAYSNPYLICYSGGGSFDSLVDGLLGTRPASEGGAHVVLGDIDGSGVAMFAICGGNSVIYFKPSRSVPSSGTPRTLPDGTDRPASGVDESWQPFGRPHLSQRSE